MRTDRETDQVNNDLVLNIVFNHINNLITQEGKEDFATRFHDFILKEVKHKKEGIFISRDQYMGIHVLTNQRGLIGIRDSSNGYIIYELGRHEYHKYLEAMDKRGYSLIQDRLAGERKWISENIKGGK